jgi:hypothetical protein
VILNKENKKLVLKWETARTDVVKVIVYRAKDNDQLRLVKTIN